MLLLKSPNVGSPENPHGRVSKSILSLACAFACIACSSAPPDTVSGATSTMEERIGGETPASSNVLIVAAVSGTGGTVKLAQAMAEVFGARLASPGQANADQLLDYSLVGFGSGIFDQMHHASIFEFIKSLPELPGRKVFIFSTSGVSRQFAIDHEIDDPHAILRESLLAKGCEIVGEFNCAGFNENSFLKFFGGMNRGKPDARDIWQAKAFAEELKQRFLYPVTSG